MRAMPSYRGVDRETIKNSIRTAVARLHELDIGAATEDMLDVWKAGAPYKTLDMAATDEELAILMNVSGTRNIFTQLTNVFRYHAAIAVRGEGSEKDKKIFQDLVAWGAFIPPDKSNDAWNSVQDEATQYMLKKCLDRLTTDDCEPGSAGYDAFQQALEHLRLENPEMAQGSSMRRWFDESVPLYIALHGLNEDRQISKLLDEKPNVVNFLISTLYKMTGLPAEESKIALDPPLRIYRAMAPYPKESATDAGAPVSDVFNAEAKGAAKVRFMDQAMDRVLVWLEPFFSTDEATAKIRAHDVTDDNSCALLFLASKNAAQAVASGLPEYQIYDSGGAQIKPAAPGFTPPSYQA
jgi:hypothetical protein